MKRRSKRHDAPVDAAGRAVGWAQAVTGVERPVDNLYRITPTLYRSAQPRREDVPALQALGIKTVISFRSFNSDERTFRGSPGGSGIDLVRVPIDTWSINDDEVQRALVAIREAEKKGPVLIHCWHGADRTGVVAAVYRMALQGWSKDAARHEMLRGGFGYHTLWRNIPRYLEQLDVGAMREALTKASRAPLENSQKLLGQCTPTSAR
ncbi:dual specificity protein phosphatase family protein [Variovorax sp. PAMC28562]|uniref:dual specificity protein phosphatase family protein n=1 Tax=Variovorax sp. PAMC28562 TaxID=2762323 RepID=UPI00164ECF43|nr:dual specificity protein phosphatase family protein [Variovorax sp. PAMC28562]QNK75139.1 dual specificity protein phosphatase family protein [Variovorax sp. PAMC28562]